MKRKLANIISWNDKPATLSYGPHVDDTLMESLIDQWLLLSDAVHYQSDEDSPPTEKESYLIALYPVELIRNIRAQAYNLNSLVTFLNLHYCDSKIEEPAVFYFMELERKRKTDE